MRESVQRSVENIYPSFQLSPSPAFRPPPPRPRHSPLRWKPLELRKIDKSSAAEQFVYSTARLRANELERITYSRGLSSPTLPSSRLAIPLSSTTQSPLPLLLGDRPSSCACDRGHWHPHTLLHVPVYTFHRGFHRAAPFCQRSSQLLTGSSVGRRGYLRPPAFPPFERVFRLPDLPTPTAYTDFIVQQGLRIYLCLAAHVSPCVPSLLKSTLQRQKFGVRGIFHWNWLELPIAWA